MSRLELLRDILKNGARKISIDGKKVYVDAFTASMLVQIYERLDERNQAAFIALPWLKMVAIGWKVAEKYRA